MSPYRTRHGRQSARLGSILIAVSSFLLLLVILLQIPIGNVAITLTAGISTVGLVMVMVALVRDRYRARWIFWFMMIYSSFLAINPPIGTIVAITIVIFLMRNWRAFLTPESGSTANS